MLRRALALALVLGLLAGPSWGQSLLPPAVTQFTDSNGVPLAGGSVTFYVPGTTTLKATFADPLLTIQNPNPITLDSAGRAVIWGNGQYRQQVRDLNGNLVWDQVTGSPTTGGGGGGGAPTPTVFVGGTSVGSANAQSVTVTPAGFALVQGNIVSWKSGFTNTAAMTLNVNTTGNIALDKYGTAGPVALAGQEVQANTVISAIYDGTEFLLLNPSADPSVALPTGVCVDYAGASAPAGWVFANSQVLSAGGANANFISLVGTTFGSSGATPDLRGRASFGVDNMGGIGAAGRLGSNSSIGGIAGTFALGTGGGQQAHTPIAAETGVHSHSASSSFSGSGVQTVDSSGAGASAGLVSTGLGNLSGITGNGVSAGIYTPTGSVSTTVSNNAGGTPFNVTPPLLGLNKICKL